MAEKKRSFKVHKLVQVVMGESHLTYLLKEETLATVNPVLLYSIQNLHIDVTI